MSDEEQPELCAFPFDRDRFRHELVRRTGRICLVERKNLLTDSVHWEVVALRYDRPSERHGQSFPARWAYPSTQEWGRPVAYTYTKLKNAERRFQDLVECYGDSLDPAGRLKRAPCGPLE
jgi:hypothetical protein